MNLKNNFRIKCGKEKIALLMFADDIALLTESREEILKIVLDFSVKWRFKFNFDKCAMLVFDNQDAPDYKWLM